MGFAQTPNLKSWPTNFLKSRLRNSKTLSSSLTVPERVSSVTTSAATLLDASDTTQPNTVSSSFSEVVMRKTCQLRTTWPPNLSPSTTFCQFCGELPPQRTPAASRTLWKVLKFSTRTVMEPSTLLSSVT